MSEIQFTELLASLQRGTNGRIEASIPEDWMQGRTTYGGLTAALCLESAQELAEDMPIRSVQVAFIGPVGGDVVISPSILRRGKNTLFVNVDMVSEAGISARCLAVFGVHRDSTLSYAGLTRPEVRQPGECDKLFPESRRPHFARHFDIILESGPGLMSSAPESDLGLWMRHRDEGALYTPTTLLALGDAPPPAAMSMFTQPGPISSMTWMAEFLAEDVTTSEGWYYARHRADTVRNGYSNQSMTMWNHAGKPVMAGRQTIAVFV